MEKQKKKMIIFTVILSVIAVTLIGVFAFIELRENNVIGSLESKEMMTEFNKAYNKKEKTVIFYSSSTCGYCELQKPIFETIIEDYDINTYSIDSNELSTSQRKEILNKLGIEHATPTIVIVENGKVVASKVGYTDGSALVDFFKENKVLPKDAVYSKEAHITFINYEEYKALVRKDETSVIVIGQTSCSHCTNYKPALNSVAEDYNIAIYKMNLDGSKEEELLKLDTYSTFLNVEGNKILYMDSNDEKGVINLLNGNSKKIVDLYEFIFETEKTPVVDDTTE